MADFGTLESGTPLPPVSAHDLKRIRDLIQDPKGQPTVREVGSVGLSARMISETREPGADVIAVFFRAVLLQHLFQTGLLDDWREGNEPADLVFRGPYCRHGHLGGRMATPSDKAPEFLWSIGNFGQPAPSHSPQTPFVASVTCRSRTFTIPSRGQPHGPGSRVRRGASTCRSWHRKRFGGPSHRRHSAQTTASSLERARG